MSANKSSVKTKDLHRIFKILDKNGDGLLSLEEINWLLESIGVHVTLDELGSSVGKPSLCFYDFLLFYDSIAKQYDRDDDSNEEDEESYIVKAFKVFDTNEDGFISCQELQSTLSRLGLWDEKSGKDCRAMIRVFDTNSDGVLDLEEFKNMMLES